MRAGLRNILHAVLLWTTVVLAAAECATACGAHASLNQRFGEWNIGASFQHAACLISWYGPFMHDGWIDLAPMAGKVEMALWPRSGIHYWTDTVSIPLWMPLLVSAALLVLVRRGVSRDAQASRQSLRWLGIRRLAMCSLIALGTLTVTERFELDSRLEVGTSAQVCSATISRSAIIVSVAPTPAQRLSGAPMASPVSLALLPRVGTHYNMPAASIPAWFAAAALAGVYLHARRNSRELSPTQCAKCRYELAGLEPGAKCPECGAGRRPADVPSVP